MRFRQGYIDKLNLKLTNFIMQTFAFDCVLTCASLDDIELTKQTESYFLQNSNLYFYGVACNFGLRIFVESYFCPLSR